MAKKDIKEIIKEIKEEADKIWLNEPIEVKRLMKGIHPGGAGSYKQNLGNLVFCNGDMRALATWITPNLIIKSLHSPDFTLEQCKKLFAWINILNIDFLAYCGFVKMGRFVHDIVDSYDNIQTKEDFFEVLKVWYVYANRMYFWIHHKFPWSLGEFLPCIDEQDVKELSSLMTGPGEVDAYFEEFIPMLKDWKTKK